MRVMLEKRPVDLRAIMLEQLLERGISQRVARAMERVERELFVEDADVASAYADSPLAIAAGQTISQPYMVALTCDLAKVRPGQKVLDVGTGSGYQAAVLAELGAEVHSIERIPALAEWGRANLEAAGYGDVQVHIGDGSLGLAEEAPFNAILAAAAAPGLPPAYLDQLTPHGRCALPLGRDYLQHLTVVINRPQGPVAFQSVACRYVPLIGAGGYAAGKPSEVAAPRAACAGTTNEPSLDLARSLAEK